MPYPPATPHPYLFRIDRQRARLNVRHVKQVGEQISHSVGLCVDNFVKRSTPHQFHRMVVAEPLIEVKSSEELGAQPPLHFQATIMSCKVRRLNRLSSPPGIDLSLGACKTTSSARKIYDAKGSGTCRPLPKRLSFRTSSRCSIGWSGERRLSSILFASRLKDVGDPELGIESTATPTGDQRLQAGPGPLLLLVHARVRNAACDANITRISSSPP